MAVITSQLQLGNNANFAGGSGGFLSDAPLGTVIKTANYNTGYGNGARTISNSTSFYTVNIGGANNYAFNCSESGNVITFNKISNTSHIKVKLQFPVYGTGLNNGCGMRIQGSNNNGSSYHHLGELGNGPNNGWGMHGYTGGQLSGTVTWGTTTYDRSDERSNWYAKTGNVYFYFEARSWSTSETLYWNDYNDSYAKYGHVWIEEIQYG